MIMQDIQMNKVAVVSGGFDPLHPGHVRMFLDAALHADIVVAGVNSDDWLTRKKGKPFMSFDDRLFMVQNNQYVDLALGFYDEDNTAIDLLYKVSQIFGDRHIVFCNGGDRVSDNTPELDHFRGDKKFDFKFGVGGDFKYSSSSKLLENWKNG